MVALLFSTVLVSFTPIGMGNILLILNKIGVYNKLVPYWVIFISAPFIILVFIAMIGGGLYDEWWDNKIHKYTTIK
jgi:hypothetical protein